MAIQTFPLNEGEKTIIKELCVLDDKQPLDPMYYIFKPEFPFTKLSQTEQRQVAFITGQIHGLNWYEGESTFCATCIQRDIINTLGDEDDDDDSASTIQVSSIAEATKWDFHVAGQHTATHLSAVFPKLRFIDCASDYRDLEDVGRHITCLHRAHGEHCAMRICYRLLKTFHI